MSILAQEPASTTTARLQIDPAHSTVEFAVKHLMISTVRGHFSKISGYVDLDSANPAASKVEVTIDSASIDTREAQRDAHLRSADFLEVEKYPAMTFVGTKIDGNPDGAFKLTGNVTIKGTTRPITLDVTSEGKVKDPWGGVRTGYSAKTRLKRSDFGLTWNLLLEAGGVTVGDEIAITIELELVHPA